MGGVSVSRPLMHSGDTGGRGCQNILRTSKLVVPAHAGTQRQATEIPRFPLAGTTGLSMEARDFAREDTGGCRCPSERKNLPKRTALLSFPMPKGQAAYRATPT